MKEKQKRFCDEYLKKLSIVQAAKAAGYSRSSGYKLMQRKEIKDYIKEQSTKINEEIKADTARMYSTVISIMEDQNASNKDRLKAVEVLGRLKNLEKETIKGNVIIMGEKYIQD